MSLHTTRIALTHALLAAFHPSLVTFRGVSLPLPAELHSRICADIHAVVTQHLLQCLQECLHSSLSSLCEDCKTYNSCVFGSCVVDWPCTRTGAKCFCTTAEPSTPRNGVSDDCDYECSSSFMLPCRDCSQPPMYFINHVRDILSTYSSLDPKFPYAKFPLRNGNDIDSVLSTMLSTLGCKIKPSPVMDNWGIADEVVLVPSSTATDEQQTTLAHLRITLQLSPRPSSISLHVAHLRTVTYQQPVRLDTSAGKCALFV
ncbi:hypothetical protein F5J12DRAFT_818645 [Pisolithus orientalis]|uniref:uncharacterized protein n=1 Tax=Pisolithus orientalis TaxID=936130 RepID=UPI0022247BA3|nr:uncharacterized protein F5J12DRAFT_818645 [Pisolithus orientalis]KAI6012550.1 hypothetical protein F5J12DRAFT_818645 [Pisolithus orientalis]